MIKYKYNTLLFTFSFLLPVLSYAQSSSINPNEEMVNVDFRLFLWPYEDWSLSTDKRESQLPLLYWKKGEEYQSIEVSLGGTSQWGNYSGPQELNVYKKVYNKKIEEYQMRLHSRAKIPFNTDKVTIFVFAKNATKEGLRQTLVINSSDDVLNPGEAMILNLSNKNILMMNKNGTQDVGPLSGIKLIASEFKNYRIPVYAMELIEGRKKRIYSSFYKMNDHSKMLLVLFESSAAAGKWKMLPVSLR